MIQFRRFTWLGLALASSAFAGNTASVTAVVSVSNTVILNLNGLTTVSFPTINYATYQNADTITQTGITASSNSFGIALTMTSNTPSDAAGNPQLQDAATPANYVPYTVSFTPCQPNGSAAPAAQTVTTAAPIHIRPPYSLFSACTNLLPGNVPAKLVFRRPPLGVLPPTGTYQNTLTFTVAEEA